MHHRTARARLARVVGALVATSCLVLGLGSTPAQAADRSATRAVGAAFDSEVVALVNAERTSRGLQPLTARRCVDRFAGRQAARMARQNRMFHQSLGRVVRRCDLRRAGENVAWRSPSISAAQVVKMWMDSPGHRANILDGRYRYIGVDAVRHVRSGRVYAAQVFGS